MKICLLLSVLIILFIEALSQVDGKPHCEDFGVCLACKKHELNEEYCRSTGRKLKIKCIDGENEFTDFRPCLATAEEDQIRVIVFQLLMGLLGGIAFLGVQARKKMNMTQFDYRKMRFVSILIPFHFRY